MIKVLQIIDGQNFGGICKLFLDVEKYISKDIKFDYLTSVNIRDDWYNLNVDRSSIKGRIIFNHRLHKFLKKNKYDIVHINSGAFFFVFFCAIICRISGVKKVVAHSHNNPKIPFIKRVFIKILNPLFRRITKAHLACSSDAIKSLFTKKDDVVVIENGINKDDYKYDEKIRKQYRKKLNIDNKIVYGHVGIFNKQKNHSFLIDVFNELQKQQDAVLLLIGNGELEETIKEKVKELNIEDKVLFLGFRDDINSLLNSMDVLLLPSLYEGLSLILIESQINGLPVVVSSNIPSESKISDNYYRVSSYDINDWVNTINSIKKTNRSKVSKDSMKNGFDINNTVNKLEQVYIDLMK